MLISVSFLQKFSFVLCSLNEARQYGSFAPWQTKQLIERNMSKQLKAGQQVWWIVQVPGAEFPHARVGGYRHRSAS
jgi:hypothetical protein